MRPIPPSALGPFFDLIFGVQRLDRNAATEILGELPAAVRRVPRGQYETVAPWLRRARVSEQAESLLAAVAQSTPASPLRFADAQELTWAEGYRKIKEGTIPFRVRWRRRSTSGWTGVPASSVGATVETDRETLHAGTVLVKGPLVSELGFDPVLPEP